jgi:DMSO/TMAO reductase YedYZ heme-binding membrane subunit
MTSNVTLGPWHVTRLRLQAALMQNSPSWLEGWALTRWIALAIASTAALIVIIGDANAPAIGLAIRFTARTSFVLFGAAFSASALLSLAPHPVTRWLRRNRRYIGVAFAASHFTHAVAIGLYATLQPLAFHEHTRSMNPIPGVIAYVFIAAMAATSFDRTAAWIGRRGFKGLHLAGSIYVWFAFVNAFLIRARHVAPGYWLPVALLFALMGLRLWAAARSRVRVAVRGV